MADKETLIRWLNDIYSMEQEVMNTLKGHLDDAKDMPDMQNRIQQHINDTQTQMDQVKAAIESLGGNVSPVKSAVSKVMGTVSGAATDIAKDKIVKDAIAEYAAEHMEIASYMAVMEAANILGESQIANMAQDIIKSEQNMADWLQTNIPMIVQMDLGA